MVAGCGQNPPRISNVTPTSGPLSGATTITISGSGFHASTLVWVGGLACSNVALTATGTITAETPASSAGGTYAVTVRNKDLQSDHFYGFTYVNNASSVTVASVTPAQGPAGTHVTITGSGFDANAQVLFGATAASAVQVSNGQTISCTAPAGSGIVDVTVTNTDGTTGKLVGGFTYSANAGGGGGGTSGRVITTFADTASAGYTSPRGVALASDGSLYVSDTENHRIRRIASGVTATFAGTGTPGYTGDGGAPLAAQFDRPQGIAFDRSGVLYVADTNNGAIREIASGTVTSLVKTGLNAPEAVAIDSALNVYVADTADNRIAAVTSAGALGVFAGKGTASFSGDGGPATSATLSSPAGIAVETSGVVWIADTGNGRIRRVVLGVISSVPTTFQSPCGLGLDGAGNLLVADASANKVFSLAETTLAVTPLAGNGIAGLTGDGGPATQGELSGPRAVSGTATVSYICDTGNSRVRAVQ